MENAPDIKSKSFKFSNDLLIRQSNHIGIINLDFKPLEDVFISDNLLVGLAGLTALSRIPLNTLF
jgi:hypothetical protein